MYTAYVNDSPLRVAIEAPIDAPELTLRYNGKAKFLLHVIGTLEGGKHPGGALLLTEDPEALWTAFRKLHRLVPAAGGAVINDGRLLCIYRRGSWDLPKGKIDEGESESAAAVREVQEETGLREVDIARELSTTYHTYRDRKGRRILKPTYWYEMRTSEEALRPQAEEDIEEARWVPLDELEDIRARMYASLQAVVDAVAS